MSHEVVIDPSVSATWVLEDEKTKETEELLELVLERRLTLVVPELWWYEMINILRTAVARRRMNEEKTKPALAALDAVPKQLVSSGTQGQAAILALALRLNLSAYDAAYLQLADSRGVRLVCEDTELVRLQKQFPCIRTVKQVLADEQKESIRDAASDSDQP
jgi:predicted nucleic acid-binding protein